MNKDFGKFMIGQDFGEYRDIFGNKRNLSGERVFTLSDKDVFYAQSEANGLYDVYVGGGKFGTFFNGDYKVNRVGGNYKLRVTKVANENGGFDYFLKDCSGNVMLGKLQQGIPSLTYEQCPSAPIVKSWMCASYCRMAQVTGLSEVALAGYVKLLNECMATNAGSRTKSAGCDKNLVAQATENRAQELVEKVGLNEVSLGELGETATQNATQNSEIEQCK